MPTDEALTRPGSSAARRRDDRALERSDDRTTSVPDYLERTYHWAYLSPLGLRIFDHPFIVRLILWGNYDLLKRAACEEIEPGWSVLQTACVYGDLSPELADKVGPDGSLEVVDVAPIQVQRCRGKLHGRRQARVERGDAADLGSRGPYDAVCCFFLLHEVPEDYKQAIVASVLDRVKPGGRAVFVDYHRPARLHPLRPLMALIFRWLEPFAMPLWRREILSYTAPLKDATVTKTTYFGGLYQKVVVQRSG